LSCFTEELSPQGSWQTTSNVAEELSFAVERNDLEEKNASTFVSLGKADMPPLN